MSDMRLFLALTLVCILLLSQLKPYQNLQDSKIPQACSQGCPDSFDQPLLRKGRVRCEYSNLQNLSSIYLEHGNRNSDLLCYLEYSAVGIRAYVKMRDSTYQALDLQ